MNISNVQEIKIHEKDMFVSIKNLNDVILKILLSVLKLLSAIKLSIISKQRVFTHKENYKEVKI